MARALAPTLAFLCLADFGSASDKKAVGLILVNLQSPYVATVGETMKVEAAKQGIDLVILDSARNVTTELYHVEDLIAQKIDLIVMNPVDQKASQAAAKLINKAGKGQLQAVVAQNDEMAIGASTAIQAADRLGEFKVLIGVDGSKPALDAIKAGTITATVFQDAVGQGTQAIVVASKILAGESVAPQLIIPFKLVTKKNVSSF